MSTSCLVDGEEYEKGTYTINFEPQEAVQALSKYSQIYVEKGDEKETAVDVTNQLKFIKSLDTRDEDGLFQTIEEKDKYFKAVEDFEEKYKKIYREETYYVPLEINRLKAQFIEDKYVDFIFSDTVRDKNGTVDTKPYKAICSYYSNFSKMFKQIALKHGFTEVIDSDLGNTSGFKFSISKTGHGEYNKIGGNYVPKFNSMSTKWGFEGSYEDCIKRFNKDYKEIEDYILLVKASLQNKPLPNALEVVKFLDLIYLTFYRVASVKNTREDYDLGLRRLKELISKINDSVNETSEQSEGSINP